MAKKKEIHKCNNCNKRYTPRKDEYDNHGCCCQKCADKMTKHRCSCAHKELFLER